MKKLNSQKDVINFILFDRLPVRIGIMVLAFLATLAGLAVPYYQRDFMLHLTINPLLLCTGLALLSFILLQMTNFLGQREALITQKALAEKLYHHILRLKPLTTSHKTVGEMVALYTTDIPSCTMWLEQTIPYALTTAFPLVLAPIFLNVVYSIPYGLTLSLILALVTVNLLLARRQSGFFYQFKILAGHRMGLVNEWIQNIKSLKSLNWIQSFESKIIKKRVEETNNRIAMVTNGQIMNSISSSVTFWLNLAVLFFIAYMHNELIGHIDLIAVMWVMGVFLSKPLRQLPWFFTMMFDAWTSIRRTGDFFGLENTPYHIDNPNLPLKSDETLVVKDLNLVIQNKVVLKDINLTLKKQEVVALIGPIGSGKSVLLKSIMKETPFTAKRLDQLPHSYLPQEPFVLSGTLTENIALEYLEDEAKIKETSPQAFKALQQAQFDIASDRISNGLQTVIGERGLNISGGQKQRLNLARLFYNPLPLFLLDDPFSAVDVGTEKRLIEALFTLRQDGHSFLVITQRYEFLKHCDRVIYIEQGEIKFDGLYREFIQHTKYQKFIAGDIQ
ncbi:ATP-binding cassette domain-containing protein [Pseudobdellovibrio sp. HCB154]|uniref:ATP-binding cassette domain-containing protein n=1 Tax=Pseudobdellovibrio sp. HCB154 TaxID=3386277 RepID=UPI003916FB35